MTGDEAGDEVEQKEVSDDDPLSEPEGTVASSRPHTSTVAWPNEKHLILVYVGLF